MQSSMISQKLKNNEKHMSELQNGFEKIKSVTGFTDLSEIVDKFLSREKTKSKTTKKNITIPFLHEVRRFEDLNELTRIFGPATLRRNVGTILTPTGRIHVAHVVTSPVRFKYDGQKGELGMQFDYKVEYVRPL
eukprot:g9419.t1